MRTTERKKKKERKKDAWDDQNVFLLHETSLDIRDVCSMYVMFIQDNFLPTLYSAASKVTGGQCLGFSPKKWIKTSALDSNCYYFSIAITLVLRKTQKVGEKR
jgi:hypothetical protein